MPYPWDPVCPLRAASTYANKTILKQLHIGDDTRAAMEAQLQQIGLDGRRYAYTREDQGTCAQDQH